jgi:hypothetical protein
MNPILRIIGLIALGSFSAWSEEEPDHRGLCRSWFARTEFEKVSPLKSPKSSYIAATSSMHGCTAGNRSYHGNGIDFMVNGERVGLTLRSMDFPEVADALDSALRSRAREGITKEDISFAEKQLLPAVQAAAAVPDEDDRREALVKARSLWKDYLLTSTVLPVEAAKPKAPPRAL